MRLLRGKDPVEVSRGSCWTRARSSRLLPLADEYPGVGQGLSVFRHECRLRETTLERAHSFQGPQPSSVGLRSPPREPTY